jgi:hypothetical protein
MVSYFQNVPERDSTVHIRADPWPRFTMKEAGLVVRLVRLFFLRIRDG